ncbi:hypothetical protein SteCoe_19202 [Stentor coeruleus]|uniref:Uncharacterized protein n=1 Tax=Stentor coeruleus TaxID=5963 RepID=A0A1R2BV24_9CILI|nr:hypothetical protein SteCoe_19202 [Stentor coeruleus]
MQTVLGSYDSDKYKKILFKLKDEQRILQLEELIDTERIKRRALEQEAKLLVTQIQLIKGKGKKLDKYRGTSLPRYYPDDSPYKERAIIRNTLMSTAYKEN